MSVPSPVLSARYNRLAAATGGDACFDLAVGLVGHAAQEGPASCDWVVEAVPRLPTKLHVEMLELALLQRAATHTNAAIDRFVVSLLFGPAEKEALVYDWYLTASPELVRPLLSQLARFPRRHGLPGDVITIPLVTARPPGQVRLSSIFRRCREGLTQCSNDADPAVATLARFVLDVMAGRVPRNAPPRVEPPPQLPFTRFVGQPRGDTLLAASATAVHRLSIATGQRIGDPLPTGTAVRCLALSLDGELAAWVRGPDGVSTKESIEICRRHTRAPERKPALDAPMGSILALALGPGSLALMGSASTRMVDLASGREKTLPFTLITYGSRDDLAAVTTARGATQLWRMATGDLKHKITTQGPAIALAFSPDGTSLATATATEIALTECATGRLLWSEPREVATITHGVHFSPDGKRIACQRTPTTLAVWDAATGDVLTELTLDWPEVTGLFLRGRELMIGWRSKSALEIRTL